MARNWFHSMISTGPRVLHVEVVSAGEGGPNVGGDPIPELIAGGPQHDVIQVMSVRRPESVENGMNALMSSGDA